MSSKTLIHYSRTHQKFLPQCQPVSIADRFWRYTNKDGPIPQHCPELGACWIWTGKINGNGYGVMAHTRTKGVRSRGYFGAHRISHEINIGPIPKGIGVCHHCDNKRCVNPSHFFLGDNKANLQDAARKGIMPSGDRHGQRTKPWAFYKGPNHANAKLTQEQADEVRKSNPSISCAKIAKPLGVCAEVVRRIRIGVGYKHEWIQSGEKKLL